MTPQLSIKIIVIFAVSIMIAMPIKFIFGQDFPMNDTLNKSIGNNQSMMFPGGNMTFGSSLDNARMHLMDAIMDLNEGNIKGAINQLNMTEQGIKMHEKEMMEMMKIMKQNISATMESQNTTS
jgi:basic membrane lipoprotein Med (substrate-binding protein (PBP1-ABC) superfamily)